MSDNEKKILLESDAVKYAYYMTLEKFLEEFKASNPDMDVSAYESLIRNSKNNVSAKYPSEDKMRELLQESTINCEYSYSKLIGQNPFQINSNMVIYNNDSIRNIVDTVNDMVGLSYNPETRGFKADEKTRASFGSSIKTEYARIISDISDDVINKAVASYDTEMGSYGYITNISHDYEMEAEPERQPAPELNNEPAFSELNDGKTNPEVEPNPNLDNTDALMGIYNSLAGGVSAVQVKDGKIWISKENYSEDLSELQSQLPEGAEYRDGFIYYQGKSIEVEDISNYFSSTPSSPAPSVATLTPDPNNATPDPNNIVPSAGNPGATAGAPQPGSPANNSAQPGANNNSQPNKDGMPNIYDIFANISEKDANGNESAKYYFDLYYAGLSARFEYFLEHQLKDRFEKSGSVEEFLDFEQSTDPNFKPDPDKNFVVNFIGANTAPIGTESERQDHMDLIWSRFTALCYLYAEKTGKTIIDQDKLKTAKVQDIQENKTLWVLEQTAKDPELNDKLNNSKPSPEEIKTLVEEAAQRAEAEKGKHNDAFFANYDKNNPWCKYNAMTIAQGDNELRKQYGYEKSDDLCDYAVEMGKEVGDDIGPEPTAYETKHVSAYDTSAADLAKKLKPYNIKAGVKFLDNLLRFMNTLDIKVPIVQSPSPSFMPQGSSPSAGSSPSGNNAGSSPSGNNAGSNSANQGSNFTIDDTIQLINALNGGADINSFITTDENGRPYISFNGKVLYGQQTNNGFSAMNGVQLINNNNQWSHIIPGHMAVVTPTPTTAQPNGVPPIVINNNIVNGQPVPQQENNGTSVQSSTPEQNQNSTPQQEESSVVQENKFLMQNQVINFVIQDYLVKTANADGVSDEKKVELANLSEAFDTLYTLEVSNEDSLNNMIEFEDSNNKDRKIQATMKSCIQHDIIKYACGLDTISDKGQGNNAEIWEKIKNNIPREILAYAITLCATPSGNGEFSFGQRISKAMGDKMGIVNQSDGVTAFVNSEFFKETMEKVEATKYEGIIEKYSDFDLSQYEM